MIHLYVLDRETWKVLKHNLIITLEEILTVKSKFLHLLAIYGYLAVTTELGTRQLTHESIEHTSFFKRKGIGIIDDSIAMLNHLDLGGLDDNLIKHHAIRHADFHWAHIYHRHLEPAVASHLLDFIVNCVWVIAGSFGFDNELTNGRISRYIQTIIRPITHIPTAFLIPMAGRGVNYRTIRTHKRYKHAIRTRLRFCIDDVSIKLYFLLVFLCVLSVRYGY